MRAALAAGAGACLHCAHAGRTAVHDVQGNRVKWARPQVSMCGDCTRLKTSSLSFTTPLALGNGTASKDSLQRKSSELDLSFSRPSRPIREGELAGTTWWACHLGESGWLRPTGQRKTPLKPLSTPTCHHDSTVNYRKPLSQSGGNAVR